MGNKKILFNFASRSRPDKAKAVVDYILTNCEHSYLILMKVDVDDPAIDLYEDYFSGDPRIKIVWGKSKSKIDAINRGIERYGGNAWDIITDISDDFLFSNLHFDQIIRDHCGPDDCLHFPEPFATSQSEKAKNENIIIMACMGRKYYDRFGYIYNPEYKSLFCDNELTAVAKKLGRYKFVNESIFYHAHPAAGYGKADAQTQHTESFWKEDKATYYRRKEAGFP